MHAIKSIVRGFFAIQAAILLLIPLAALLGGLRTHLGIYLAHSAAASAHHLQARIIVSVVIAGMFACGLLFAMAWWTTRTAKPDAQIWAIVASVVNLGEGTLALMASHLTRGRVSFSLGDGLWCIALGAAGLFLFGRNKADDNPSGAPVKRNPVAGDRTSGFTRDTVRILSVVAQIAAIVVWSRWGYSRDLFRVDGLVWIALVVLASLLTTLIHECGHALIAWCFEMSLLSFKVGPLQWVKREGKWNFKLRMAGLLTPGGAVGAVSKNHDQPRWEEVLMIAAGSLANSLIGIPAAYAVIHDEWPHYQQTWELAAFTASFCMISAVLNLVPFLSEDGAYSDGARILQILTDSPVAEYHKSIASIARTATTELRYRDLDVAAIQRAAKLFPDEFRGLHLNLCACHCYEDASRFPEAAAALAGAEAIYNNFAIDLPGPLHTVFIIGHAYLNRDARAARTWWNRMEAKKNDRQNVDCWLARTALLWIEGDKQSAEQAWVEADSLAQALPEFGAYEFDRFRCFLLRQVLDEKAVPKETIALAPMAAPSVEVPQAIDAADDAQASSPILPAWITPASAIELEGKSRSNETLAPSSGVVAVTLARAARTPTVQPSSFSDSASMFARLSSLTARPATVTPTRSERPPDASAKNNTSSDAQAEVQGGIEKSESASNVATSEFHSDFLDWAKPSMDEEDARTSVSVDTALSGELAPHASISRPNEMCSARPIAPLLAGTASITPLPVEGWTSIPSLAAPPISATWEPVASVPPMMPSQIEAPLPPPTAVKLPMLTPAPFRDRVFAPAPSKGPSVPAAFARKARIVGPIPEFSFAAAAIAETSTVTDEVAPVPEQDQSGSILVSADLIAEMPADSKSEPATVQPPSVEQEPVSHSALDPAPSVAAQVETTAASPKRGPLEAPRFDPLAFIRAAAIETLSTR